MMHLDDIVGEPQSLLDELGVADNTLVMFSTDNGGACNSWPDGGNHPFRAEKGVGGFEGAFRVPMLVRWPGNIPAGVSTYKVHLDGFDQSAPITGKGPSKRKEFFYFTETSFHGLRYGDWKVLFKTQDRWFNGIQNTFTIPLVTNLKLDPFERFHEARGFDEWQEDRAWVFGRQRS